MAGKTAYLAVAAVVVIAAGVGGYIALRSPGVPAPAPSQAVPPEAHDPCLLPGPPPVPPDGATATAADISLGHDTIQAFVIQLENYQACRNNQIDHPAPGVTDAQKETWTEQGNAAVDEAHAMADAFSAQLKIFKARAAAKQ